MGHVNSGTGVHFSPVKKAIERLLVFFAQSPPKGFPPFTLRFQNKTERHNCPARISSRPPFRLLPFLILESQGHSSFDALSRRVDSLNLAKGGRDLTKIFKEILPSLFSISLPPPPLSSFFPHISPAILAGILVFAPSPVWALYALYGSIGPVSR
jgi:hypothetical protein